ncbi:glycosyltransferase family 9 protein [Desulfolutivibrio sulfoxidireducens]|uniref:glycosyltransferase family 9 protein n=1 Tax=Desulfolutivibrio sulfoxidireducens TaxID=2773299 RepID=UPI00210E55D0|nr:glycosyltransferase family 9 protein [Desulfolutivibrio sulfoxidireducens]
MAALRILVVRVLASPAVEGNVTILVLQMQRMGDLILSFPLFLWLKRAFPGARVRVVAEPMFFEPLAAVGPGVEYVGWAGTGRVMSDAYGLVINLSHRSEAAVLAGRVAAARKVGPVMEDDGVLRVHGAWQLYRASVVRNNRHNRYHWADLNALDVIGSRDMAATRWDAPRHLGDGNGRVALFLGASQPEKRPDADFWGRLAGELARRGLRPVLLGGPAEVGLGREVMAHCRRGALNMCGRLGLAELARVAQTFNLFVTPDTGPMHLAAWTGCRVLNLSMGPVNPWETGPYQPGHYVLRGAVSCRGCWECSRPDMPCRRAFDPARVAYACWRIVRGESARLFGAALSGLDVYRTARDDRGVYRLEGLSGDRPGAQDLVGDFWAEAFGHFFGLSGPDRARAAWERLALASPKLAKAFTRGLARLGAEFKEGILGRGGLFEESFWAGFPPFLRPFTGYAHMCLHNADFSRESRLMCLDMVSRLAEATKGA